MLYSNLETDKSFFKTNAYKKIPRAKDLLLMEAVDKNLERIKKISVNSVKNKSSICFLKVPN